jgi:hypothetical protein
METVKIDVPNFDGFEAFYGDPEVELDALILNGTGEKLVRANGLAKPQICYRRIQPKRVMLELVGVNIPAAPGEYYRLPDGTFMIEREDDIHSKHREVWRLVEEQS